MEEIKVSTLIGTTENRDKAEKEILIKSGFACGFFFANSCF
ncbi:MAG: hypothetical protein ACLU7M_03970 [Mediterraneibacter gnavus]